MTANAIMRPALALSLEAHAVALFVRILVRTSSLKRAAGVLAGVPRRRAVSADTAASCVAAARQATARVAHPTCLYQSLVAFALLARRGYAVTLHVGARRRQWLEAHAWLTIDGHPYEPETTASYTELWRVLAAPAR